MKRTREPMARRQAPRMANRRPSSRQRAVRAALSVMAAVLVLLIGELAAGAPALAITAPELRGQRALQDLSPDMHGRNLQQQEFLKANLENVDLHDADLRGAVFNASNLRTADLRGANLEDVVAYASRFDGADLRGAMLHNAMLLQSHFHGATIDGADFTDAVLDKPELKALCARASGTNPTTGVNTLDSLACR